MNRGSVSHIIPILITSLSFLLTLLYIRRWFERAAAQNDPEGLYNVGIFHNNGQAGLEQNPDLAMQYFHRAADHANPFPMALHAVGKCCLYIHLLERVVYIATYRRCQAIITAVFCCTFITVYHFHLLHIGNHYMYGEQKNFTRAMSYLLKAAAHRSDDAHFSLAMLYR